MLSARNIRTEHTVIHEFELVRQKAKSRKNSSKKKKELKNWKHVVMA